MLYFNYFSNFILEKKSNIEDIISDNNVGLIIYTKSRFGTTNKSITLFNFKENEVLAHIEFDNTNNKNYFEIHRSYDKKSYAAIIYDFALMYNYPEPIIPSKVITQNAINIWKYYYELRDDVIKDDILSNSPLYSENYKNFLDDSNKIDNNLTYLNCMYLLEKSKEYDILLNNGIKLLKNYNLKPNLISNLGYKQFKKSYDH